MLIHLIRHAQAIKRSPAVPDEQRFLTCRGRKRFRKVSGVLRNLNVDPDYIFTSPKIRAVQTADILAEKLLFNGELIVSPLLADFTLQSLFELLQVYLLPKECVLVGHDPDFSELVAKLLNLSYCSLSKGSVVTLKISISKSILSANFESLITGGGELISKQSKAIALLQKTNLKASEEDDL
jgi:phosphohistidine phosphatase